MEHFLTAQSYGKFCLAPLSFCSEVRKLKRGATGFDLLIKLLVQKNFLDLYIFQAENCFDDFFIWNFRRLEWNNFEATVVSSKQIHVKNVMNEALEKLDFRDRIIKISLSFGHLVVATSSQCYIYR